MPTPEQIQQAIRGVTDQRSFIDKLLRETLNWPIYLNFEDIEDITYEWTDEELNTIGLSRDVLSGPVLQMQSLEQQNEQPWGIFILEFANIDPLVTGRGLTGPLRKVLRGLVPTRRRRANLPAWNRENLLFVCTYQYRYFRFAYFKPPKEQGHAEPLVMFGWEPGVPPRTVCEFNLDHLEWPDDPDNVEAWQEQWLSAFDKEKLTKDFFSTFAVIYYKVVADIAEVRELKDEAGKLAQVLLDRMLFLYFIQRKGWLDQKLDYLYSRFLKCWNKDPDGHSYYSSVLYPLFLSLSNTNFSAPEIGSVPFLNGGLFEESTRQSQAEQIAHARLKVKNSTFKLIFDELLERFNFTVTEDTPLDVEVAIDPEMLGKIFESLILQLEKEPGKDLRKLTGSYYTPRPIVHFMCREALKEYLVSQLTWRDEAKVKEKVGKLLALPQADQMDHEQVEMLKGLFTPAESKILRQSILDCRVCDPAVGSGAFPVGILHEMVAAIARLDLLTQGRDILTQHNYYYDLKKQIIESCLYGVDIQEQAVRLCELRLWLSLVVDYQIVPTKTFDQAIRKVPSLPNLSYRIMRGDSLLERLFGHVIQLDIMAKDAKTKQLIESIQADKQAYFREGNNEEKRCLELKILAKQADLAERFIGAKTSTLSFTANIFGEEETKAKNRKAKAQHEQRLKELAELKAKVSGAKSELERLSRQDARVDRADIDTLRRQYFHSGDAPTFMWCIDFAEVFEKKGGFDIVIANPPYVQIKKIPWDDRKIYEKIFTSAVGRFNLFYFFLELSGSLAKPSGISTFIVPDRLLLNTQCDKLRKWLLKEQTIIELDSFAEGVFEAVVDSIIILYRNVKSEMKEVKAKNRVILDNLLYSVPINIPTSYFLNSPSNQFDLSYDPLIARLLEKIKSQSVPLGEISEIKDGIIQSRIPELLFLKKPIDKESKQLLFGKDVQRYSISFNNNWVNYKPDEMMKEELKRVNGAPGLRLRKKEIFERNKILTRQTADEIIAAYDKENYYYSNTLHGTTIIDKEYHPLYVLCILNSKLTTWYYRRTTAEEGKVFAQIKIVLLRLLPIKKVANESQKSFIYLVDKILNAKKANLETDTKHLEKQIDQMVYNLYGLTEEEIAIVE